MTMLVTQGLDAGYGRASVLRDVNVVVSPQTVVALVGPNGAGKTTLLRTIAGVIPSSAGRVMFDGCDITRLAASRRAAAGLCLVPEGRGIFPHLSVRDNLRLQATKGREEATIERAVAAFPRLGERLAQVAGTMSGGEQQMLALSRAYTREPKLILLDEVSFGLAPIVVDEIYEFLAGLQAAGRTLLLVEQFVDRALDLATHVYLLQKGAVMFSGTPRELRDADLFGEYLGSASADRSGAR